MSRLDPRFVPAATVAATIVSIGVLATLANATLEDPEHWVGHGLGHFVVAFPVTVLGVTAIRAWPPPRPFRLARIARRVVVAGLLGLALGQFMETLGARVDERAATTAEVVAHTAGQIVTMLGVPVLLVGGVLSLSAGAKAKTIPRWAVVVGALIFAVVLVLMYLGVPDPDAR